MSNAESHAESVADVAEDLMSAYDGAVSCATISAVVLDARSELRGQIPEGALPELLHRLADQRLCQLATSA
jgi:hypothetical protein